MPTEPRSRTQLERRVADRIRRIRDVRERSQQWLADELGLPRSAVTAIEQGNRVLSLDEAVTICRALNVPIADLVSPEPLMLRADPINVDQLDHGRR